MHHIQLAVAIVAAGIALPSLALAWGSNGHQIVGTVADTLISQPEGATAQARVLATPGTSLGQQVRLRQTACGFRAPELIADATYSDNNFRNKWDGIRRIF